MIIPTKIKKIKQNKKPKGFSKEDILEKTINIGSNDDQM